MAESHVPALSHPCYWGIPALPTTGKNTELSWKCYFYFPILELNISIMQSIKSNCSCLQGVIVWNHCLLWIIFKIMTKLSSWIRYFAVKVSLVGFKVGKKEIVHTPYAVCETKSVQGPEAGVVMGRILGVGFSIHQQHHSDLFKDNLTR